MSYHPIMGILIFFVAIFISFILGRFLFKKSLKTSLFSKGIINKKNSIPRGEITSPDAPWLKEK